jgi:Asp/Glu/hydantoin racemase
MNKLKIGLIRVVTLSESSLLEAHEDLLLSKFQNFDIETKCIEDQPEGIHDEKTKNIAVPKIIKLAQEFEKKGKDVVFISCADDPAVKECHQLLHIPIVGAGSACASIAFSIGNKIGILGITEKPPKVMSNILKGKLVFSIKPEGVNTTLDLFKEQGKRNALKASKILKEKGCDTIALACTGTSTIHLREYIEKMVKVTVVDPVIAAGLIISYLQL